MNIKILIALIILIGLGLSILFFYTYSVSGRITDLANKEPIPNIRARIGELADQTNEDGLFQIRNIKIYQREALKIEAPENYEQLKPISIDYSYVKRAITKDIELEPTLMTIVHRLNTAMSNSQYDYLWNFMHPDDKQYWDSKEDFIETFQKIDEIMTELDCSSSEYKIVEEGIREFKTWKYRMTGKEYRDVTEVPVKTKRFCGGKEETVDTPQFYQKIDGVWRYFTYSNKEEMEEELKRFKERSEKKDFKKTTENERPTQRPE